ncbi:MAG: penicillin-binding transpeptidase domain-containing protein [Acidobacteriota bacterium]
MRRLLPQLLITWVAVSGLASAGAPTKKTPVKTATVKKAQPAPKKTAYAPRTRRISRSPWTVPTYAPSTEGDNVDGEDLAVRRAAVEALGPYNGTVVAVDPQSGRILAMVNQRLALTSGFQPCSTVKIFAALAALSEGIIGRDTLFRLTRRTRIDLTEALAHSNNPYFANLGIKLGYERFSYYARLFGLGERAGLGMEGESAGILAASTPKNGGMGMMTSFGEGISLTPLQLSAFLSAISNGGTLYYLQYPRSEQEVEAFVPRVKRHLDIAQWIDDIKPGMIGAVEYGTARRAYHNAEAPICGKTGTCTDKTTHLGWFGSFSDFGQSKLVVVVLMTGGKGVSGPEAAEIAGAVYRRLYEQNYFASRRMFSPAILAPR